MEVPFDLGPWHGGHREDGRRPVRGFIWEVSEGEGAGEMGEAGGGRWGLSYTERGKSGAQ